MSYRVPVFAVLVAMASTPADAERPHTPKIKVEYTAPTTPGIRGVPFDHVAKMKVVLRLLEHQIRLPHTIKVAYRECGSANAYYRAESRTVEICHELYDKRRSLYLKTNHDRQSIDRRVRASLMFTCFHELGHALHDELELPLLGRDEDAVDDIATIWMIRLGLADAARLAAWGHHLRAQQPEYRHAVWDDHATGGERGFAIACLLYGSDPQRHVVAMQRMRIPAPQILRCKKEFEERLEAWAVLFRPHLTTRV